MPGARAFTVDHEITDPAAFLVPNVELHMVAGTRLSPDSCWSTDHATSTNSCVRATMAANHGYATR